MKALLVVLIIAFASTAFAGPARGTETEPDSSSVQHVMQSAGVSREEAVRRLRVQMRATNIGSRLEEVLGPAYGGIWFDTTTGDFHVAMTSTEKRSRVEAILAERRLLLDTHIELVAHSERELLAGSFALVRRLEADVSALQVTVGVLVRRNALEVRIADDASPSTRARVADAASASGLPVVLTEVPPDQLVPRPVETGTVATRAVPWRLAGGHLRPSRRSVTVAYRQSVCVSDGRAAGDELDRVRVRRWRHSLRITLVLRDTYQPISGCKRRTVRRTVRVRLGGRLGTRSLLDGSARPARVRRP